MSIQPIPLQKLKHHKSKQDEQLVINYKNFNRYMLGPTASSRRWHSVEVGWERQSTGAAQHPLLHWFRNKDRRPKSSQITSPKMTILKKKHGKHGWIDFDMATWMEDWKSPRTKPRCSSVASRGWLARQNCETLLGWGHSGRANLSEMMKCCSKVLNLLRV